MPVSERLYYNDAFLQSFPAAVSDVRELSRAGGETLWQIALDRTAFYPTSGGQPHDLGSLHAVSRGGAPLEIPVEAVEEDEDGQVWHFVRKPVSAGTHVEGRIDWQRRFDHMQQHTGQHLLSALFLRELNAPTVSFHLGEAASTIDLSGAPIGHHSLERIERLANEVISEDRPVTVRYVTRAEAESLLAAGHLRKLPERAGDMRLIEIAGLDRSACGGTHVRSTGQIGGALLRGLEKVSRGTRVSFVCGLRAVHAARADAAILAQLTASLSVGPADIPAAVDRLRAEAKSTIKERQRLREDLADYHASRLAVEVPIENGLRLVNRAFRDRDPEYVRLLASRLTSAVPGSAVIFTSEMSDSAAVVVVARSMDLSFDCGLFLKQALAELGLRGGGSASFAHGEAPAPQAAALRASLASAIRAAVTESR
ncbi:MAG TPA: DHHA1 domain-containing protein [Acidobacteriaceae bacterium]|jgi:alanyl-tRNA synthetase|nr:DHHA1 domain-containing protein [Acidobacteriaceae bacterium]